MSEKKVFLGCMVPRARCKSCVGIRQIGMVGKLRTVQDKQ